MSRMACAVVLLAVLQGGCVTAPQTRLFVDLPRYVSPGDHIQLVDTSGQRTSGLLAELSPTSLALLTDAGRPEFSDRQVARIERYGSERQPMNPVKGLAKGAYYGAGIPLIPLAIYVWLVDGAGDEINYGYMGRYIRAVAPVLPVSTAMGAVVGFVRHRHVGPGPVYKKP